MFAVTLEGSLSVAGDLATILTACVAVGFASLRWSTARSRQKRLVKYLLEAIDRQAGKHKAHSLVHLAAELGMTESEVMQAAFGSKAVKRSVAWDRVSGRATEIMLSYVDNSSERP